MNQRVEIVRIPNSGGSALAGINRSLAGPLRALLFPLLLLVLAAVVGIVRRSLNRRKQAREALSPEGAVEPAESEGATPAS
jgi:hypothetical protein